ncbi:B3 domain-containing protein Os01g0234100-like isoform X4 [Durio zibethinus]|uniref:B3 domain-containing protein Os01g0234100-like isoform X4 n=1 Tax=Durio zibethinus TaxID=66656 RepID=A0A6P5Z1D8_DURZI|nr:B3 domain-containing protein Os01g0234100-like isoform X4 [Durio zibethinus]
MHTYISIIYICIFTCMQWKGNMFVFLGVPKYVIAFPFFGIYQVKRGRPPKCKLFRKKLSGLDKITVNQGLPKHFCSKQLPKENRTMVLEDEEGKEFQTKYLVEKVGLSGGWRGFSIAHKLLEGDVCVFHLVKPSKFKVYIVRRKGSDEVDVALGLLKLESSTQQIELEKEPKIFVKTRDKPLENYGMYENRISVEKTGKFLEVLPLDISEKAIQNDRLDLGSEVLDSIKLSESMIDFKEVKNFEDFNILVNGLIIDSEFSKYLKTKYYELCCNQKSFLHENLLEGLNCKLVAGVIAETINIADAIRAAKLTTSHHSFLTWGQTLKSFKGLGMKVGFLSARLDQLMNLSMKSRRYQEARLEQINANEKKRKLEAKLVEVTEALNRLVVDIGSLEEENADRLEILFQEVASAPR